MGSLIMLSLVAHWWLHEGLRNSLMTFFLFNFQPHNFHLLWQDPLRSVCWDVCTRSALWWFARFYLDPQTPPLNCMIICWGWLVFYGPRWCTESRMRSNFSLHWEAIFPIISAAIFIFSVCWVISTCVLLLAVSLLPNLFLSFSLFCLSGVALYCFWDGGYC